MIYDISRDYAGDNDVFVCNIVDVGTAAIFVANPDVVPTKDARGFLYS
jgi:hypothetical protein